MLDQITPWTLDPDFLVDFLHLPQSYYYPNAPEEFGLFRVLFKMPKKDYEIINFIILKTNSFLVMALMPLCRRNLVANFELYIQQKRVRTKVSRISPKNAL